jgi:paired amphipathic helix protein Sin3a
MSSEADTAVFRPGAPQQQVSQPQVGGNVLLPQSYHPAGPSSNHTLPTLADLTQGGQSVHHQHTPYNTHPPPSNTGHSLPGLGHTLQQSPQGMLNQEREREARERERREIEMMERQRQREELHMREQEQMNRDRELAERAHREQLQHHPVQNHTGSIPIHQPVASKVPNTIHGPNGLLSNLGSGSAPANSNPASNGPSGLFSMASQQQESTPRPAYLHANAPPPPPQPIPGFAGPGPSPMPGHAAIGQQQPILNVSALEIVTTR